LLVIAAAFGFQVMITLYLQRVLGYGAAASGLGLLPTAAVIGTVALGLSARIAARFGPRPMLLAGLALITAGLALLTLIPVQASYPTQILPPLLIFGVGGGPFNTTQQIGAALGVAVLSTLAAAQTRSQHSAGANTAAALAAGYHLAFATAVGLAGTAIVVAAAVLWPSRRRAVLAECC
jgi:MFS family permease